MASVWIPSEYWQPFISLLSYSLNNLIKKGTVKATSCSRSVLSLNGWICWLRPACMFLVRFCDSLQLIQSVTRHKRRWRKCHKLLNSRFGQVLWYPCFGTSYAHQVIETFSVSEYCISANSLRGNYSFLNLALCTVTFGHCA